MSRGMKRTLISASAIVLAAIITGLFGLFQAGVFSQKGGSTPTPTPTATPSSTPIPNPYPPSTGRLVLNDPLADNSRGYMWDEGSTTYGNCNFQQDSTYHGTAPLTGDGM